MQNSPLARIKQELTILQPRDAIARERGIVAFSQLSFHRRLQNIKFAVCIIQ